MGRGFTYEELLAFASGAERKGDVAEAIMWLGEAAKKCPGGDRFNLDKWRERLEALNPHPGDAK